MKRKDPKIQDQRDMKIPFPKKLLLAVLLLFTANSAFAQGPVQPEAMQFEPIDVTDVVNLATGDFVYTVPLMEVPGPEGGYPIVLSYHSGIGPNQPATWVGLGWTLNPGAVNRILNGYPDDYDGDIVRTIYESKGKKQHGVSISAGWGPIGINMGYNTNSGFGMNLLLKAEVQGFGVTTEIGKNGINSSFGINQGIVKAGLDAGTQGIRANLNADLGIGTVGVSSAGRGRNLSVESMGLSILSGDDGLSISSGSTGFQSVGAPSNGYMSNFIFGLPIILPNGMYFNIGYSQSQWILYDINEKASYGSLNQSTKENERYKNGNLIYPSKDQFLVSSQGMSGPLSINYEHAYVLRDHDENDKQGYLDTSFSEEGLTFSANTNPVFRFSGDKGYNSVSSSSSDDWGLDLERLDNSRIGGKVINPILNGSKIIGFELTDTNGMIYEFATPSYNYFQYSETIVNESPTLKNFNSLNGEFATTWFLSSIKGPDYVDRGTSGISDEDWGYWIKFNYESASLPQVWRTPYSDYFPADENNAESFNLGIRETLYLESIESQTHRVKFNRSLGKNQANPSFNTNYLHNPIYTIPDNRMGGRYYFKGDYSWVNELSGTQMVIYAANLVKSCTYNSTLGFNQCGTGYEHDFETFDNSSNLLVVEGNTSYIDITFGYLASAPNCSDVDLKSTPQFTGQCHDQSYAKLLISNVSLPGQISFNALDNIELFSKEDQINKISSVEFGYDYSLRPNSNGSTATETAGDGADGGTLTLRSLHFEGQNQAYIAPPYRFEYAYGDKPGMGFNPSYHKDNYDVWGSYRDPSNGSGYRVHNTTQDQELADLSAAWSLTKIITPTGSETNISYESDDYYYVNDTYDFKNASKLTVSSFSTNSLNINGSIPSYVAPGQKIFLVSSRDIPAIPDNFSGYSSFESCQTARIQCEQSQNPINCPICEFGTDASEINIMYDDVYEISSIDVGSGIIYTTGTISQSYDSEDSYELAVIKPKNFGGGTRVKSVETKDGSVFTKTIYEYEDGGFSSGVTATMPNFVSGKHGFKDVIEKYEMAFLDHELSFGRPSPGVIYSKVKVTNVNGANSPVNGYTEVENYTPYDYPYIPTLADYPVPESNKKILSINDRSMIYGKTKSKTFYEQIDTGGSGIDFRPVTKSYYYYTFSEDLSDSANVYKNNNGSHLKVTNLTSKPLALSQEKYVSRNEITNGNWKTTRVERVKQNIFSNSQKSERYFYDSDQSLLYSSKLVIKKRTIGYDMYTGQQLVHVSQSTEEDELFVNRSTPAWWKYGGMESKNMLTQGFENTTYRALISKVGNDLNIDNITALKVYDYPKEDVIGGSVTTWDNQWFYPDGVNTIMYTDVWRKNDSYSYISEFGYEPFPSSLVTKRDNTYPTADATSPWRMSSNIVTYDGFGHTLESVNEDGTYQSVLIDESNNSLVKAVAGNAKLSELQYYDFEDGNTNSHARTGESGASLTSFGAVSTPVNPPIHGGKYKVGMWIKSSGTFTVESDPQYTGDNTWQFITTSIAHNETLNITNNSGSGSIDDVTIVPEYASISYFAYDPVTWKVIAMTGPDHRTTFYEYDDAGRLILTRDFEKNIITKNEYGYSGEFYIDVSPDIPIKNQLVTFSLKNSNDNSNATQSAYSWSFGDGVRHETTSSNSTTHTYSERKNFSLVLTIEDDDGNSRRILKELSVEDANGNGPINISLSYGLSCASTTCDVTPVRTVTNGYGAITYVWSRRNTSNDDWVEEWNYTLQTYETHPLLKFEDEPFGSFQLKLKVTDSTGTTEEKTITVVVGD